MKNFVIEKVPVKSAPGVDLEYIKVPSTNIVLFEDKLRGILFVRQYRDIFGLDVLELPGGGADDGEGPLEAVVREFFEETGIKLKTARQILHSAVSVGTSNEVVNIFIAGDDDVEHCLGVPESGIELVWIRRSRALATMLKEGLVDAKSMLGLSLCLVCEFKE